MPVRLSGAAISVHFDARTLQQPVQVEEAPAEQRNGDTYDNQEKRERGAIAVLTARKSAPIDVKRVDGRVVERDAFGEKENVFEAHQQRERLVDRHEADRPAQRGKRNETDLRQSAGAVDRRRVEQMLGNAPDSC